MEDEKSGTNDDGSRGVEPTLPAPVVTPLPDEAPAAQEPVSDSRPSPWHRLRTSVRRHRVAASLLAVLATLLALALVLAFRHAGDVPAADLVEADARARLAAPSYDAGTYGHEGGLVLVDVSVDSQSRDATAITSEDARFGAAGYATAEVTGTWSNGSVSVTQTATLGYAKVGEEWVPVGSAQDVRCSYAATRGVDTDRIASNPTALLERADQEFRSGDPSTADYSGTTSLAGIYANANLDVSESFDAETQTDVVTLWLEREQAWWSYSCTLKVTFSLTAATGAWEVSSVEVSEGADTRRYDRLVGTWAGTFQSQETEGTKCLAASGTPLSIAIESASTGRSSVTLSGTFTGLAHYHDHPSANAEATEGDQALGPIALSLTSDGSAAEDGRGLTFVGSLPEGAGGRVSVTITFGSADDPDEVTAIVQTTVPSTSGFLFFQYAQDVVYKDSYVMSRVG